MKKFSDHKFWINSNSGDYISLNDMGEYHLYLISRFIDGVYFKMEILDITAAQFQSIKGFIPIKYKKLFFHRQRKEYAPTLSDGSKGTPIRTTILSKQEARDLILKDLGICN